MKSSVKYFIILASFTAVYSIFSMLLMSDIGQFFAMPKSWIIAYYEHAFLLGLVNVILLLGLWYLHLVRKVGRLWVMLVATVGVLLCIFAANMMNTLLFPTKQHTATYVSVTEADRVLADEQVIYVLEINGEVRGYPQDHLELPHVAGGDFGGQEVVMTYCGLSNLPVAMNQDLGSGESDLRVMAQVHNNLILKDNETGELVQQITATTEFGDKQLEVYPNTMMTWKSFKQLYPEAEVFVYSFDRMLDPIFRWFFAATLEIQNDRSKGAAFPTVSLDDDRLNPKEAVWGYRAGDRQIAFTKEFAKQHPVYPFEFQGEPLVLTYDKTHDIITLFSRLKDGEELDFHSIDFRGQTDSGKLDQKPLYNGVYWMVWTHWFPDTQLNDQE
ncbi:DUF3179 domain-containing protein [Verrucomicrobiaceae bacterium N1E253]|uniref:DUF3179 domain-containing protein n=1 Tax=Oceaniferula marina TaxID=2748318 RepID=A0A851GPU6_9BACT|nr:DUF3179 domain-containing (seleno)protein [Oceaniferula marina]NWK57027.1 DUF3179 domain-containing protein [Oceaniferula marina]